MTRSAEIINISNHDGEGFDCISVNARMDGGADIIKAANVLLDSLIPSEQVHGVSHIRPGEHRNVALDSYAKDGVTVLILRNTEKHDVLPFYRQAVENGKRKDKQVFPRISVTFE